MRTAELRRRDRSGSTRWRGEKVAARQRFVLGIVSLGVGIPITAISASESGLLGIAVAWAGIVGVNVAAGINSRRRS